MHSSVHLRVDGPDLGGGCGVRGLDMGPVGAEETVHRAVDGHNCWQRRQKVEVAHGVARNGCSLRMGHSDEGRERDGRQWIGQRTLEECVPCCLSWEARAPPLTSGVPPPSLPGVGTPKGHRYTSPPSAPTLCFSVTVLACPLPTSLGSQCRETKNLCCNTTSWKTRRLLTSKLLNY